MRERSVLPGSSLPGSFPSSTRPGQRRIGSISKMDRYLQHLLVVSATAIVRYTRCGDDGQHLGKPAPERKPVRLVTVAVANKWPASPGRDDRRRPTARQPALSGRATLRINRFG
jgi:hypothetical protein